jgi:hypothetical protein
MANFGAENPLEDYPNLGYNVLGQAVDMSSPDLASGYYLYDENPEDSACPDEMRAGKMVIKGAGTVDTCAGRIFQENLPDIYVVDYRFKTIIRLIMMASIVMLIIAIAGKI